MTTYLDCNATTPMEHEVAVELRHYFEEEYGNSGSRSHEFGARAKAAVQSARKSVAGVVNCQPDEVLFTSGATEANNLAILGLEHFGRQNDQLHIVTTSIEHKAVLEPIETLEARGFEVTVVDPKPTGRVDSQALLQAVRTDTLLVSVMHANNETGVLQPLKEICDGLADNAAYLHVDAAQTFGKELDALQSSRIDLTSISAHKCYGPKGVGALVVRRRGFKKCPLQPLMWGGNQERGLRPGTLPVALIAGLGKAAELAAKNHQARNDYNQRFKERLLAALEPLNPQVTGKDAPQLANTLNFRLAGLDSEAAMLALKGVAAVSNGSACTSANYTPSHVLLAMGFAPDQAQEALRFSWCHLTPEPDYVEISNRLSQMLR
jgi:cysteine desulfurase